MNGRIKVERFAKAECEFVALAEREDQLQHRRVEAAAAAEAVRERVQEKAHAFKLAHGRVLEQRRLSEDHSTEVMQMTEDRCHDAHALYMEATEALLNAEASVSAATHAWQELDAKLCQADDHKQRLWHELRMLMHNLKKETMDSRLVTADAVQDSMECRSRMNRYHARLLAAESEIAQLKQESGDRRLRAGAAVSLLERETTMTPAEVQLALAQRMKLEEVLEL